MDAPSEPQTNFQKAAELGLTEKQYETISNESICEARQIEADLRAFYKDPFGDQSARWWLAEFSLDYLKNFKPEGSRRKDKPIENILHELRPARLMRDIFRADKLPREVTFQIVKREVFNGRHFEFQTHREKLPETLRSLERLFCAIHLHDIDEDYPAASKAHFLAYIDQRIDEEDDIPSALKVKLKAEACEDAKSMETLSFGRKGFDSDGSVIKIPTHNNDRQVYSNALESHWPAIGTKAPDRDDGLRTRYGYTPDYFTIQQDLEYLDETRRLFMYRQSLEEMQKRYPELANYFDIMNNRIQISMRCLGVITEHHPSKLKLYPDPTIHTETAEIDVTSYLEKGVAPIVSFMDDGVDRDLERLLIGLDMEVEKHPSLTEVVNKMARQFGPYINPNLRPVFSKDYTYVTPAVDA